jgi:hypothetical protein
VHVNFVCKGQEKDYCGGAEKKNWVMKLGCNPEEII